MVCSLYCLSYLLDKTSKDALRWDQKLYPTDRWRLNIPKLNILQQNISLRLNTHSSGALDAGIDSAGELDQFIESNMEMFQ